MNSRKIRDRVARIVDGCSDSYEVSGDDFIFAAAVLNDDGRNAEQVADIGLAFTLTALGADAAPPRNQRFHKTVCEDRLFDDGLSTSQLFRLSAARLAEQAEDFQIEPDERNHQAERAIPFHVLRRSVLDTSLDHVKIENQIQCRDDDHKEVKPIPTAPLPLIAEPECGKTTENHFH